MENIPPNIITKSVEGDLSTGKKQIKTTAQPDPAHQGVLTPSGCQTVNTPLPSTIETAQPTNIPVVGTIYDEAKHVVTSSTNQPYIKPISVPEAGSDNSKVIVLNKKPGDLSYGSQMFPPETRQNVESRPKTMKVVDVEKSVKYSPLKTIKTNQNSNIIFLRKEVTKTASPGNKAPKIIVIHPQGVNKHPALASNSCDPALAANLTSSINLEGSSPNEDNKTDVLTTEITSASNSSNGVQGHKPSERDDPYESGKSNLSDRDGIREGCDEKDQQLISTVQDSADKEQFKDLEHNTIPLEEETCEEMENRTILEPCARSAPEQPKPDICSDVSLVSSPLTTLTCAVSNHETTNIIKRPSSEWCDVGIFKGTNATVTEFYQPGSVADPEHLELPLHDLPNYFGADKIQLEPGAVYKFRVAAVNACGRGPWSEVSTFRTGLPGFPGSPTDIKIVKLPKGVHLSWEPPVENWRNITEYSLSLAVQSATTRDNVLASTQLVFIRVYSGPSSQAIISYSTLTDAYIDITTEPAVIFRVAAKNDKGYGPATQIRWLQDIRSFFNSVTSVKRTGSPNNSPSKQSKVGNNQFHVCDT